MKRIYAVVGLVLGSLHLSATDQMTGLLRIPQCSLPEIQRTFGNLREIFPLCNGERLGYREACAYRVHGSLAFGKKLETLVPDSNTRGYLLLQLSRFCFGACGCGEPLETAGLRCLERGAPDQAPAHFGATTQLLRLYTVLQDMQNDGVADVYGFCDNSQYYYGALVHELRGLKEALTPCPQAYTGYVAAARSLGRTVALLRGGANTHNNEEG